MELPKDPVILLSYVNTKLRDEFATLDAFCKSCNVDKEDLCKKLNTIDYHYDETTNCFV